jgi:RNA polymerase sigma factor (TIGR02999 family)
MADAAARTQRTQALLARIQGGDLGASAELIGIAYEELHGIAEREMRGRNAATLQPTALVNEVCVRLLGPSERNDWTSKAHLLSVASKAMRGVLVDHARARDAEKRGGGLRHIDIESVEPLFDERGREIDLCALDSALEKLAAMDPELAEVVELRFFGGLSVEETARVRGVSEPTIVRGWRVARLFLQRELEKS